MPMSYDTKGRRIVEHHTLLAWLRTTIQRNDANRRNTPDTPTTLEDLLNLP